MASPVYSQLLTTISSYVEKDKASGIIERQLKAKELTPDSLSGKNFAQVVNAISTAASLYVPDPKRRDEMKSKILALA